MVYGDVPSRASLIESNLFNHDFPIGQNGEIGRHGGSEGSEEVRVKAIGGIEDDLGSAELAHIDLEAAPTGIPELAGAFRVA